MAPLSKRIASLVLLFVAAPLASAGPNLIGGEPAAPGQFPFIVNIGGCTATKTGEKEFLIAAHCLYLGPGNWKQPARISVSASELLRPERHSLPVESVKMHPTWMENCRELGCTGHETGSDRDLAGKVDLARIRVTETTPNIPWIEIESQPLARDSEVTLAGFGCTRGIGTGPSGRLRYAKNSIASPEILVHPGSLFAKIWEVTGDSNWVTPGAAMDPKKPALCPGDSGGPLLIRSGDSWRIAGIAADYTFTGRYEAWGTIPMTNLHTRLDDQSRHGIARWLREP